MSLLKVEEFLEDHWKIKANPENFITSAPNQLKREEITIPLKRLYDALKKTELKREKSDALPELIIEGMDDEQIWQQIELQNNDVLGENSYKIDKSKLVFSEFISEEDSAGEEIEEENHSDESSEDNDDNEEPLDLDKDSDEEETNDEEDKEEEKVESNKYSNPSIVDDQFFKLDEMEAFLKSEEKKVDDEEIDSGNDSESDDENKEVIDYFENEDDSDDMESKDKERGGCKNPTYKDFFGEAGESIEEKRNKFLQENEEKEEERLRQNPKSSFELREERLKNKIEQIEGKAVKEKSWQLKGEITADGRPQNSLLEEIVDFDLTTRPAPVMTEQSTMQLEDIIRQRIKDKAFDDVQRKQKPSDTPLEYKKKLVLNQEKSKESLAQIYEKEFLEQKESLDPDAAEKEEVEPPLHIEIRKMRDNLFRKLDALCNFHFTPKFVTPELKIVSNLPAITMEEVAPISTTDAALLAPEEVKGKIKGDIIGKSERTDTDKKRDRRKKKLKQQKHAKIQQKKEVMKKVSLGITNKYSKEKAKKMLDKVTSNKNVDKMDESATKKIKSSTAFFEQMEEEVKSQLKGKTRKVSKADNHNNHNAKKLKL